MIHAEWKSPLEEREAVAQWREKIAERQEMEEKLRTRKMKVTYNSKLKELRKEDADSREAASDEKIELSCWKVRGLPESWERQVYKLSQHLLILETNLILNPWATAHQVQQQGCEISLACSEYNYICQ